MLLRYLVAMANLSLFNPRRACTARVTVLGLSVCVCVSVTQHLTLNVIIHATNDSNLPSGGWRSKILSDFLWKCFVAKLERFLLVRLRDKSAIFYSTENTHAYESIATSQSHSNSAVVEVCEDIPYLTSLSKLNSDDVVICHSFRGIARTSVILRSFDYLLPERIRPGLQANGHPLLIHTAYQKHSSCQDAIFSTQESILKICPWRWWCLS